MNFQDFLNKAKNALIFGIETVRTETKSPNSFSDPNLNQYNLELKKVSSDIQEFLKEIDKLIKRTQDTVIRYNNIMKTFHQVLYDNSNFQLYRLPEKAQVLQEKINSASEYISNHIAIKEINGLTSDINMCHIYYKKAMKNRLLAHHLKEQMSPNCTQEDIQEFEKRNTKGDRYQNLFITNVEALKRRYKSAMTVLFPDFLSTIKSVCADIENAIN